MSEPERTWDLEWVNPTFEDGTIGTYLTSIADRMAKLPMADGALVMVLVDGAVVIGLAVDRQNLPKIPEAMRDVAEQLQRDLTAGMN